MLNLLKPVKTCPSFLKDLPIEQIEQMSPQLMEQKEKYQAKKILQNYCRHDIFKQLKERFFAKETHKYDEIEQTLSQYFEFVINPVYKKIESLPIPIFVCGYCKEVFLNGIEYLLHCSQMKCQINHERSTFFVCFKGTSYLIGNKDLQQTLSQNDINSQKYEFFGKSLQFVKYQLTKKKEGNTNSKSKFICGQCNNQVQYKQLETFLRHIFGPCNSFQHKSTSHEFKILENVQPKEDFIKDIENFCLNYNILSLFDHSYVKTKRNFQFKLVESLNNEYFCQNCQINFSNEDYFLAHALFKCKKVPDQNSSYQILQKKCQIPPQKPLQICMKKYILITKSVLKGYKRSESKDKKWKSIVANVNSRYEKIWKDQEDIYFCACCFNFYHELGVYLTHFNISQCTVNHTNNSHFLTDEKGKLLKIEQLLKYAEEEDVNFLYRNTQAFHEVRLYYKIDMINLRTGKQFSPSQPSFCGKCGLFKIMSKSSYVAHIMRKCKSPNHPQNSHRIVYKHQYIVPYEIKQCLRNIQLCLQILNINPLTNIFIFQNQQFKQAQTLDLKNQFYCGKCKFSVNNKYQFYLHYLTRCEALNSPDSSHLFKSSTRIYRDTRSDGFEILRNFANSMAVYKKKIKRKNRSAQSLFAQNSVNASVVGQDEENSFSENELEKVSEQNEDKKSRISEIKLSKRSHVNNENDLIFENKHHSYIEEQNACNKNELAPGEYLEIYPNFEFDIELSQTKYYCGKCDLKFKKKQAFIDHIFTCFGYHHPKSSHFILTLEKYKDLYLNNVLNTANYHENCQNFYPSYIQDTKNVVCGCGATKIYGLSLHFSNIHSGVIPKGTSHFVLRIKILKRRDPVQIFLPVQPKPQHQKDQFICPCNPFKKWIYRDFANHIIRRHEGRSPVFYMKSNNSTAEKMELN